MYYIHVYVDYNTDIIIVNHVFKWWAWLSQIDKHLRFEQLETIKINGYH